LCFNVTCINLEFFFLALHFCHFYFAMFIFLCFALKFLLSLFRYVMGFFFINKFTRSLFWLSYDVSWLFVHTLIVFFSYIFRLFNLCRSTIYSYVGLYVLSCFFYIISHHSIIECFVHMSHATPPFYDCIMFIFIRMSFLVNITLFIILHEWNIRKSCNRDGMCVINLNC